MLTNGWRTTVFLLIAGLAMGGSAAAEDFAAQVRAARDAYRPLDQTDVVAARADLNAAIAAVEARFAKAGTSAEGWRNYLGWAELKQELAKPAGPDLAQLEKAFGRLSAGHEGLRLMPFATLRDSIRTYVGVVRGVNDNSVKERFGKVLDALAGSLESHTKVPNGEDAAMITAYLHWLRDARQAPELIQAIRSASLNRNLHAHVSAELLAAAMGRDVDETLPVHDCILGTSIHGTGRTTGTVGVGFIPSQDVATIQIMMSGTNLSNTVGYNGPAVIYANGTTRLTTQKQIVIDGQRIWGAPAHANATTHSNIRAISVRNGRQIIENIAWKRARKQKCQAEAIAAQHAEWEAGARFDAEVNELIGPANDDLQKKIRGPLVERGLYPAELQFSTDKDYLRFSMLQAGGLDLGATTQPPETTAGADLRLQIHESTINNFTSAALAGMLLKEQRVQEAVRNLTGKLPKELESEKDALPWAIAFQSARPIWVAFGDNQFTLSIRGRSFYEGDTRHPAMNVTVTYRIVGQGESVKAVRQGDVEIFPPDFNPQGGEQLSAQETAIRRILQRRLGRLFEEEIIPDGLVLPKQWSRAGILKLVQWEARDGWLVLSWKRTGQPAPVAEPNTDDVAVAQ